MNGRKLQSRGARTEEGGVVAGPVTRARTQVPNSSGVGASDAKQRGATAPVSSSTEILSLVQAAEQVISKLLALCVRLSNSEKAQPASAIQPIPQYVDEERVAEITGMSRVWFQRARSEGIGPRWVKIARRVAYPLADVVQWIESGAAAREHLSSRGPKKGKRSPKEGL